MEPWAESDISDAKVFFARDISARSEINSFINNSILKIEFHVSAPSVFYDVYNVFAVDTPPSGPRGAKSAIVMKFTEVQQHFNF